MELFEPFDHEIILSNELAIHNDNVRIKRLVEAGIIDPEALKHADIIAIGVVGIVPSCKCNKGLEIVHEQAVCPICGMHGMQE